MKRLSLLSFSLLGIGASLLSCKSIPPEKQENSEEKGLIEKITNPRLDRNEDEPWVKWQWYHGTRDDTKGGALGNPVRALGVGGALIELDGQRLNLVQKNLVDTNGAYKEKSKLVQYKDHRGETKTAKVWAAYQDGQPCGERKMSNPEYRARTLTGRCNDFDNAPMGAVGERFARNVQIEAANKALADFDKNGLEDPNPREISKLLLERQNPYNHAPAPFFNLWAATWIQFMTHDWFAHAENGVNDNSRTMTVSEAGVAAADRVGTDGKWTIARSRPDGGPYRSGTGPGTRPTRTAKNLVSHWWDASQLYGWDAASRDRVRDPNDRAKLRLDAKGTLPLSDLPGVKPQETAAFFDNWWVGLSLLHTTFSREHNLLVDRLRDPANRANAKPPSGAAEWTDEELFDVARLCISALLAKIHTIEWTPQLLFNQVGDHAMHSNWNGLLGDSRASSDSQKEEVRKKAIGLAKEAMQGLLKNAQGVKLDALISLAAAGPGIVGMKHAEHFDSPFTLPEEFTAVYRLHSLLPDHLEIFDADAASRGEFRTLSADELTSRLPTAQLSGADTSAYWWLPKADPNQGNLIAVKDTLREKAHETVQGVGIDNLAMTFGVTPVGQLTLGNFPRFMTKLEVPGAPTPSIDLAAMDIIRDRERGVPRYNEFRRQLLLNPLRSFDDFVDRELEAEIKRAEMRDYKDDMRLSKEQIAAKKVALAQQKDYVEKMKKLYKGDIEKVDLLVGTLAEFSRPHGFAISETQFQVFILNASRRLFSDRFFTEAFTPDYYTKLGYAYVNDNSMTKVLTRQYPKLSKALNGVENAFEMWNRKRDGFNLSTEQKSNFLR